MPAQSQQSDTLINYSGDLLKPNIVDECFFLSRFKALVRIGRPFASFCKRTEWSIAGTAAFAMRALPIYHFHINSRPFAIEAVVPFAGISLSNFVSPKHFPSFCLASAIVSCGMVGICATVHLNINVSEKESIFSRFVSKRVKVLKMVKSLAGAHGRKKAKEKKKNDLKCINWQMVNGI